GSGPGTAVVRGRIRRRVVADDGTTAREAFRAPPLRM
ncbi:MAG: hypothetical protein QOK14_1893, partial [Frankiaceae bacterium]|nr:hypothetical protein [Frankiaceae bacterium]